MISPIHHFVAVLLSLAIAVNSSAACAMTEDCRIPGQPIGAQAAFVTEALMYPIVQMRPTFAQREKSSLFQVFAGADFLTTFVAQTGLRPKEIVSSHLKYEEREQGMFAAIGTALFAFYVFGWIIMSAHDNYGWHRPDSLASWLLLFVIAALGWTGAVWTHYYFEGHVAMARKLGYVNAVLDRSERDWVVREHPTQPSSPEGKKAAEIQDLRVREAGPQASREGIWWVASIAGVSLLSLLMILALPGSTDRTTLDCFFYAEILFSAYIGAGLIFAQADRIYPHVTWIEKEGRAQIEVRMLGNFPGILWRLLDRLEQNKIDIKSMRQINMPSGVRLTFEPMYRVPEKMQTLVGDEIQSISFAPASHPVSQGFAGRHFLVEAGLFVHQGTPHTLKELTKTLSDRGINIESIRIIPAPTGQVKVELVIVTPWTFGQDPIKKVLETLTQIQSNSSEISYTPESLPIVPNTIEVIALDMNEATAQKIGSILFNALESLVGKGNVPKRMKLREWKSIPGRVVMPGTEDRAVIRNVEASILLARYFHGAEDAHHNPRLSNAFWPATAPQFRKSDKIFPLAYLVHSLKTAYNRVARQERNQLVIDDAILHDSKEDAGEQIWEGISPEREKGEEPWPVEVLRQRTYAAFANVLYNPENKTEKPEWLNDFYKAVALAQTSEDLRASVLREANEILELRIHQYEAACPAVILDDMNRLTLDRGSQYEKNIETMARSEVRRTDRVKMEEQLDNLETLFFDDKKFQRKIVAKSLRNMTLILMRDLSDSDPTIFDNGYRDLRMRYFQELVVASFRLASLAGEEIWLGLKDFIQDKNKRAGEKEEPAYTAVRSIKALTEFMAWLDNDSLAVASLQAEDLLRFKRLLAELLYHLKESPESLGIKATAA